MTCCSFVCGEWGKGGLGERDDVVVWRFLGRGIGSKDRSLRSMNFN